MLDIKPSHKPIKSYYEALKDFEKHGITRETSVRNAFQELLTTYARKLGWSFVEEYPVTLTSKNKGAVDGAVLDPYSIVMGYWEAKDSSDDLGKEVKRKFDAGYPRANILFQEPLKAILYQDGIHIDDYDLTKTDDLVACLRAFFEYKQEEQADWGEIVEQFKQRIREQADRTIEMIEEEKKHNVRFKQAFQKFSDLCRTSINPNLSDDAIEEMLVQHLLTSRIFESVFDRRDFDRRNIIAKEIEEVIDALTSREFSREKFFAPLDHFYRALELRAKSITDWSQKQSFLNTVYEKFFQGFAVKVADTHGIVYTPQPIVDFMVRSVEHILKTEFGRSLSDEGVHILDPFTGTGNFIMRIMREIKKSKLPMKYAKELHCNEIMLLPYYIASMNIEHEYYEQTGEYKPFEGICLVDTFELAEPEQMAMFSSENTERVERQKKAPIFVIIANPPYNAGQANENDNNKVRKYPSLDQRVALTFSKDSKASNKNDLIDPYIKAYRYAMDRVGDRGLVAFVTNNNFVDGVAFDGIRKHLRKEFCKIYHIDLRGNARTSGERRQKEAGNIFNDQIRVGVGITLLVRDRSKPGASEINIYSVADYLSAVEKQRILKHAGDITGITFTRQVPDKSENWLTEGMSLDFESLVSMGTKLSKAGGENAIFDLYCLGNTTNRDSWAVNFSEARVGDSMRKMIEVYNDHVSRYARASNKGKVDDFVQHDDLSISWSRDLKLDLMRGKYGEFAESKIRSYQYRPFQRVFVFFDKVLNEEVRRWPNFLPIKALEGKNVIIAVSAVGNTKPFHCLATNILPDLHLTGDSQCFPFYTYDEDGSNRRENITDWALEEFRTKLTEVRGTKPDTRHPKPDTLTKWHIFYYVYGILHHPEYRTKYAANLRRELPRVPVSPDFWRISEIGKELADLHVNYEEQKEYDLDEEWSGPLDYRVEKMKLTKDKSAIVYNERLTLRGVPPEVFEYKLGNRSALEWIIDQYQVSTDKRSGITNDPNRDDQPDYILRLIGKVITVSLATVKLVEELKGLRVQ